MKPQCPSYYSVTLSDEPDRKIRFTDIHLVRQSLALTYSQIGTITLVPVQADIIEGYTILLDAKGKQSTIGTVHYVHGFLIMDRVEHL